MQIKKEITSNSPNDFFPSGFPDKMSVLSTVD
jgi:hypothetical protein